MISCSQGSEWQWRALTTTNHLRLERAKNPLVLLKGGQGASKGPVKPRLRASASTQNQGLWRSIAQGCKLSGITYISITTAAFGKTSSITFGNPPHISTLTSLTKALTSRGCCLRMEIISCCLWLSITSMRQLRSISLTTVTKLWWHERLLTSSMLILSTRCHSFFLKNCWPT